jgi:hypothetical protein
MWYRKNQFSLHWTIHIQLHFVPANRPTHPWEGKFWESFPPHSKHSTNSVLSICTVQVHPQNISFHTIPTLLAFSTQVRGVKTGRSRWIFKGENILSMPSFGGEVKPLVPCCRFAACRRSLNGVEDVILAKLPDNISRPQFHLSLMGSLASLWTWRHLATKLGTSKGRGK